MRILYAPSQLQHIPPGEFFDGEVTPHQEVPARVDRILEALSGKESLSIEEARQTNVESILREIHSPEYLSFLADYSGGLTDERYHYPSVFRYAGARPSQNLQASFGYYSLDTYTPIGRYTRRAALDSAGLALSAATYVLSGENVVYALCRPPGHHAQRNSMGGYCYLNNAAVAATALRKSGRVAILDVDFHHGNGTQNIFYEDPEVCTVSLHADPNWKFPFFTGYATEHGNGRGEGTNLNIPLPAGTDNHAYSIALKSALHTIEMFDPKYLVVSFGADTHIDDPIGGFALTTEYYREMANQIGSLGRPTVIVQEGGYNTDRLGTNVYSFISGFIGITYV